MSVTMSTITDGGETRPALQPSEFSGNATRSHFGRLHDSHLRTILSRLRKAVEVIRTGLDRI